MNEPDQTLEGLLKATGATTPAGALEVVERWKLAASASAIKNNPGAFYHIEHFDTEMSKTGCECSIVLAKPMVAALLTTKRNPDVPANKLLENRVKNSLGRSMPAFHFYKDTWFLTSFSIASDCACFGIEGTEIPRLGERNVRYTTHNIRTSEQAAVVLSTWLLWFGLVVTLTPFGPPD